MAWCYGRRLTLSGIVERIAGTKVDSNRTSIVDAMNCDNALPLPSLGPKCHTTNQTKCKVTAKEMPRTSCAQRLSHHAHAVSSDEALSSFPQNREREDSLEVFVTPSTTQISSTSTSLPPAPSSSLSLRSSSNSKLQSPSPSCPYVSVSLILALSGSSP